MTPVVSDMRVSDSETNFAYSDFDFLPPFLKKDGDSPFGLSPSGIRWLTGILLCSVIISLRKSPWTAVMVSEAGKPPPLLTDKPPCSQTGRSHYKHDYQLVCGAAGISVTCGSKINWKAKNYIQVRTVCRHNTAPVVKTLKTFRQVHSMWNSEPEDCTLVSNDSLQSK